MIRIPQNIAPLQGLLWEKLLPMCVSPVEQDAFSAGLERFQAGYEKQLSVRRISELRNSTSNVQTVFEANGTRYIDMTLFTGSTYSDIREKSLHNLCKRMKAVTQVVGNYHKAGLLHLDIKPDNIFAIPETCELVMLFDFDSVVKKDSIGKNSGLSCTKTWAAPEQVIPTYRKKVCEATDLYAIGEMIFWQIFGRHSEAEEHRSFYTYQFDTEADIFKNTNPKVFGLLSDLLHHTIAASVVNRYQSAEELIAALDELIKLSDPKEPYLVSTNVTAEEFFIGRDNELRQIHEMLSDNSVLYLCGMGGIGKSELARNYVKQYRKDYDTVFFATYMGSWSMLLTDDYHIQIANFHSYEGEKPEDYCARKLRKLKELCDERTLFVIDNVNEDEYNESENECFRQIMALPCRFLFTSRLHEWSKPMLDIGVLPDHADLVALFEKWCHIKDEEQMNAVNAIIDCVDCHTLTLELIAKQTTAGFTTPTKMLAKLQEHGMRDSGKEKIRSDKDLTVTKKTAFEHICDLFDLVGLTDDEKYVMANMALIPTTGIEATLFMEWCEIEDADDINSLIAKGWIDRDEEIIKLHSIVAEVSLNYHYDFELGDTVMLKKAKEYLTANYLSFSPDEKKKYADFAMEMARALITSELCSDNVGGFLCDVSYQYSGYGNPALVINAQKCALSVYKRIHGENHPNVADSLDNLGALYHDNGSLDTAQLLFEQSLTIRKTLFGEGHPDVADSCNNLGALYADKGDWDGSLQYHQRALNIRTKLFDVEHPDVANSLNNLGILYADNGNLDTAQQHFEQALAIFKKHYGDENQNVATVLNNLGSFCDEKGDWDVALRYHEQALAIRRKRLGKEHLDVAVSLYNLGAHYDLTGDTDTAMQYYEEALSIYKKLFGELHPDVALCFNNMGVLYDKNGIFDTALQYYERALAIRKSLWGENHPQALEVQKKINEIQAKKQQNT